MATKNEQPMKLYVWRDVLTDWSSGVIVAMAHDVEEARQLARQQLETWNHHEVDKRPSVHRQPAAAVCHGGG